MAKFMDVHNGFVGVTEQQLREARECDLAVEAAEGVHFGACAGSTPRQARRSACRPGRRKRRYAGCTPRPGTHERIAAPGSSARNSKNWP